MRARSARAEAKAWQARMQHEAALIVHGVVQMLTVRITKLRITVVRLGSALDGRSISYVGRRRVDSI